MPATLSSVLVELMSEKAVMVTTSRTNREKTRIDPRSPVVWRGVIMAYLSQ